MKLECSKQVQLGSPRQRPFFNLVVAVWCLTLMIPHPARSDEGDHAQSTNGAKQLSGHSIPGASFQVFLDSSKFEEQNIHSDLGRTAFETVVQAFTTMVQHRSHYPRLNQALTQDMLGKVVIEPKVANRDGKEFLFLVARTKQKGKVKLLINASRLKQDGYLNHPETLAPRLAKEFQWVISKASTPPKRKGGSWKRDLAHAPIHSNTDIKHMPAEEREQALLALLDSYIQTVDAFGSLTNQPYYQLGTLVLIDPDQPDSTTKLYDIRIREALLLIVKDPYFWRHTPKAVRSLLNGKIWQVTMVKIDDRDWTTRTRVVPKDKAVQVGMERKLIQPAKVLVNYHRAMEPGEDLYAETQGLPMGALSADQLARVIAWEIQNQITEKSMRGHVAEDERSAPGN